MMNNLFNYKFMIIKFINFFKSGTMKVRSLLFLALLFCVVLSANTQTSSSQPLKFSLSEAKDYALNNSPILLNSARDVEIAKKMIWENTATGLPQVNVNSQYAYSPQLAGLSDQLGTFIPDFNPNDLKTSFFIGGQVDQLIFNGAYIVGLKAAKVYANLSELADTKSRIGIEESITNTYFTALVARQSSDILDSTLTAIQQTLYQSEQMFNNGFLEQTDVDQLKILESNIKSNLSVTLRQIGIMERMLKFQMGLPIDQPIILTDQIDPLVNIMNLETAVIDSFDLGSNVDYNMMQTQEKLRLLNYKLSKSMFLPTVSGYYSYYKSLDNNFFNDQSPNTYGLSLAFPIFSSGMRLSQVKQREIEYQQAQTNKKMGADDLRIQYESALSGFLTARDVYFLQQENRNLALRIYRKSIIKFQEGVSGSLDLNTTQQQYFTAEGTYFNALMALVTAKTKLDNLLTKVK
jgi:outer membrane protein